MSYKITTFYVAGGLTRPEAIEHAQQIARDEAWTIDLMTVEPGLIAESWLAFVSAHRGES
jgi:hypothetical protein